MNSSKSGLMPTEVILKLHLTQVNFAHPITRLQVNMLMLC